MPWLPFRSSRSGGKAVSCHTKQRDKMQSSRGGGTILWEGGTRGGYFQRGGSGKLRREVGLNGSGGDSMRSTSGNTEV